MYEAPGAQALVHEAHVGYRPVGGCVEEGVVVGGCGGLGLGALEAAAPVGRVRVTSRAGVQADRVRSGRRHVYWPAPACLAALSPQGALPGAVGDDQSAGTLWTRPTLLAVSATSPRSTM